jgi:AraC-like DNA-binding protein
MGKGGVLPSQLDAVIIRFPILVGLRVTKASSRTSAPPWRGTLLVSSGHALYVGPAGDTRPHRHHALQLVVALEEPFEAQIERATPRRFESLLIAADCEHRIEGRGLSLAIYYVDGSCEEGRVLSEWLAGEMARALPSDVAQLRRVVEAALAEPSSSALPLLRRRVSEVLQCAAPGSPRGDPAIAKATALLEESLASPLPVPELARRVNLRQRELSARFRSETGLTIRRYVLWVRLKAALSSLAEQRTLTEAAHAAGFADAAHLSRTFVQMFGVSPSESVAASNIQALGPA